MPDRGTATYRFCLYEDVSGSPTKLVEMDIPAGGLVPTCVGKPCWKVLGPSASPKGYKYRRKDGASSGVTTVKLKAGDAGKAQVQIKAKGKGGLFSSPAPPLTGDVTAQLLIDDGGALECFQATYTAPHQTNEPGVFKAKGP